MNCFFNQECLSDKALYHKSIDQRVKRIVESTGFACKDFVAFLNSDIMSNRNELAHANIIDFLDDVDEILDSVGGTIPDEREPNEITEYDNMEENEEVSQNSPHIQEEIVNDRSKRVEQEKEDKSFEKVRKLIKFSPSLSKKENQQIIRTLRDILLNERKKSNDKGKDNEACKRMYIDFLKRKMQEMN